VQEKVTRLATHFTRRAEAFSQTRRIENETGCGPSTLIRAEGSLDELNRWLGRREAFGLMAGRCSAADVECMKRIRDSKLYLGRADSWPDFCLKYLHMGKSNANRLIALLEKFGAEYFHITQITRISPADYGQIAPAVTPEGIAANGEIIPLTPENSDRIATAVESLRHASGGTVDNDTKDPVDGLHAAGTRLVRQFRELAKRRGPSDPNLASAVSSLHRKVERLLAEVA
jgi:hypothetical protein